MVTFKLKFIIRQTNDDDQPKPYSISRVAEWPVVPRIGEQVNADFRKSPPDEDYWMKVTDTAHNIPAKLIEIELGEQPKEWLKEMLGDKVGWKED